MRKLSAIFTITFLSITILLSSCTSTTRITSEPPGAKVFINNNVVGETPYVYSDSKISLTKTNITLELEGYETFNTFLTRDEEPDVGAIIGGVIFFWPFLWSLAYYPEHHYILEPIESAPIIEDVELNDNLEQLKALNEMYKEGIITVEEFERLKNKIIDKEK